MSETKYDLAIIGAGWAGFNAAIRGRELGLKVVLIEEKNVGGTCLNLGCIPTKALIQSAKTLSLAKKAAVFGVKLTESPTIEFDQIQARKNKLILQLVKGMESMLKGIDLINGKANFQSSHTLIVNGAIITAENILICCGSKPQELSDLKFDGKKVVSSDGLLNIDRFPNALLIVGGGVIGCEFADLFNTLGSKVTIIELMPQLLPGMDPDISKKLENSLQKKGIDIKTNTNVRDFDLAKFDLVLVAVGRKPDLNSLGLDTVKIKTEKNAICIDENFKTNVPGIYAAGDCTGKTMLAHFASFQGKLAAEIIAGKRSITQKNPAIPTCVYTDPEIACVGLTQEQADKLGLKNIVKKFDLRGSGMARIQDEFDGFIKVIIEEMTDKVLGACIIGPKATELISVFTLAIDQQITASQLGQLVFPHPSISEAIAETLK